jgi:GxxExxY protein
MVNFGLPDIKIERYAFHEKEPVFVENYEYIKDRIDEKEREILAIVRAAIKDVAVMHKLGYGKVVWRKIVTAELDYKQLSYNKNTMVPVQFSGKPIRTYRLRHLIIENKIILMIVALQKAIDQSEVANMQSYLKALQLNTGLIVNFGKSEVHISGVRAA